LLSKPTFALVQDITSLWLKLALCFIMHHAMKMLVKWRYNSTIDTEVWPNSRPGHWREALVGTELVWPLSGGKYTILLYRQSNPQFLDGSIKSLSEECEIYHLTSEWWILQTW
jgi:hypothetical protein